MADEFEELYGHGGEDEDTLYHSVNSPSQSREASVDPPLATTAPSQGASGSGTASTSSIGASAAKQQQQQMPTTNQYSAKESGMKVTSVEAPQHFAEPLGSSGLSALFIHDLNWVDTLSPD